MTSYPRNSNPLAGPNWRQALRDLVQDEPQDDVIILDEVTFPLYCKRFGIVSNMQATNGKAGA
ncbi:hypothetical protein [Planctomicrobium piriforme]|uniref:Uncharacterized protein n=1 Tax=Planctomicrobium piriforme TaxID=1576369 RepID=A0A1I3L1R8_9PLAN|nr:hypothetical protein [Planctomicrobium piriforme]SFI78650.1 hypothetical protein SAMN05421753_112112 [Planctomicrobium piriforme]